MRGRLYLLNKFIKCYSSNIGYWILYLFLPIIGMFVVNKASFIANGQTPPNPGQVPPPIAPTQQAPSGPLPPVTTPPPAQ